MGTNTRRSAAATAPVPAVLLRRTLLAGLWAVCLAIALLPARAARAELLQIPTGRGSTTLPVFWAAAEQPRATVLLLPGGDGVVPFQADGTPKGGNFLVRTYPLWLARGLNVMVVGTVQDSGLTYEDRVSAEHAQDLARAAAEARRRSPVPVWLVGTSRGTASATAAAIRYAGTRTFDGVVLTSAVVTRKVPQAVTRQAIGQIDIPVLVYMHEHDACPHCLLADARSTIGAFSQAPIQAFQSVVGGSGVSGNPCRGHHHHGFYGMEEQAVGDVAAWILHPQSGVRTAADAQWR